MVAQATELGLMILFAIIDDWRPVFQSILLISGKKVGLNHETGICLAYA